jgi:dihydrofolate reductase
MGRRTYESIGRLLPGRTSVIVTRQRDYDVPGAIVVHSLKEAIAVCEGDTEIFVIGGAGLFRETLPIADRIYLTVVDAEPEGDTFMPEFAPGDWQEREVRSFAPDEKHAHAYRFAILDRSSESVP